jgi:hypothetical protein
MTTGTWVKDVEGNFVNLSQLAVIRRFRTTDGQYKVFGYANADDAHPCVILHEVKTEQEISLAMFEISSLVSLHTIETNQAH